MHSLVPGSSINAPVGRFLAKGMASSSVASSGSAHRLQTWLSTQIGKLTADADAAGNACEAKGVAQR